VLLVTASKLEGAVPRREITVSGAELPWILVLPLTTPGSTTYHAKEKEPFLVPSAEAGPLLICVGAGDRATLCEQTPFEGEFAHTFPLDEGRLVEGRCFIGRRPAARATVSVRPAGVEARRPLVIPLAQAEQKWVMNAAVDDTGRFRIEHLAPGEYVFEIVTAGGRAEDTAIVHIPPRKAARPGDALPPREYQIADIRLTEGVAVTVEVRAVDGKPVPNAGVAVVQQANGELPTRTFERTANAEGVATFDGVDGRLPVRIACAAPGFARFSETFATSPPLATCTLERLAIISGRVVDSQETSVEGAVVELLGQDQRQTAADATGAFTLKELVAGTYRLRASSLRTGIAVREVKVAEGQTLDVGAIEVGDLESVHGRVVSAATGEPIQGAAVSAVDPPGATTVTDAEGMFELSCDPAVSTIVHVTANGYARAQSSLRPTSTESSATIRLQSPGAIEVTVWDDAGEPCAGCTINISSEQDLQSVFTNALGVARQDGLTPGEYQLARELVSSTSRQVTVRSGGETQVGLVRPNATTRVQLGSPARPLRVLLTPSPAPGFRLLAAYETARFVTAVPAPDGSFSFRRTPGQSYDLRLESASAGVFVGRVPRTYSSDVLEVQIGTGMVEIGLTAHGAAAAGILLDLVDASGTRAGWAITDAAGTSRILHLRPGGYTVNAGGRTLGTVASRPGMTTSLNVAID
jgi:Carboxypeptidase regulatory-like domain